MLPRQLHKVYYYHRHARRYYRRAYRRGYYGGYYALAQTARFYGCAVHLSDLLVDRNEHKYCDRDDSDPR